MALKSILDSIDDLSEELKAVYKPQKINDKDVFVLDVEGIESHPGAKGLKATLEKHKKDLKDTTAKLNEATTRLTSIPEDFSPEKWEQLRALEDAGDNPDIKKLKETYDSQVAALKANHKTELTRLKSESDAALAAKDIDITNARNQRANDRKDVELTQELVRAGIRPELMNAAKALHISKFKHEFEDDGTFRTFRETDTGEQTVSEFVSSWINSDEGKAFVAPAAGGGAGGGNKPGGNNLGDNPFSKGAWSKTHQAQLYKTDKVKAERLAKAAGFANISVALSSSSAISQKEGA